MTVIEQEAPIDESLRVDLVMTPAIRQQIPKTNAMMIDLANELVIEDHATATWVANEIKSIDAQRTKTTSLYQEFVAGAKQTIETAKKYFQPTSAALEQLGNIYRAKLTAYDTAQREAALKAKREAEERERDARQRAEAEAARVRREAAAETARLREADAQAERERLAAIAANDMKAAQEAASRQAETRQSIATVTENAEAEATVAELSHSSSVAVVAAPPKIDGYSTRKSWKAECLVDEKDAINKIVAAIKTSTRDDLIALLALDMPNANALAKAQEDRFNVPGMTAKNNPIGVKSRSK